MGLGINPQPFYKAIKKYGWKNIEHKIIFDNLSPEQAKDMEEELIRILRSNINDKGYNVTDGGDGVKGFEQINVHPVYCIDLQTLYKTVSMASCITGDNEYTISNICKNRPGGKAIN